MVSCFDIADYFVGLAQETGSFVSNLKLQKLVDYAQAWHLALHEAPLFEDDFQAWVHGPVIPVLYQKYKPFGWQPILTDIKPDLSSQLPESIANFLGEVAEEYFACNAYELERMTHVEDPWLLARKGVSPDTPSTAVIEKDWMREYYGAHAEKN